MEDDLKGINDLLRQLTNEERGHVLMFIKMLLENQKVVKARKRNDIHVKVERRRRKRERLADK